MRFCSRTGSVERRLEFDKRPRHHSLTAEKRKDEMVVARHHGTHFLDAGTSERVAESLEELRPYPLQASFGAHLHRKNPTARRLAEFPGAHLPDDKSLDAASMPGDEKESRQSAARAVACECFLPILALGETGDFFIQGNQLQKVRVDRRPDVYRIYLPESDSGCHGWPIASSVSPPAYR